MPGNPGSSKGCITCRRRKLKCDLHHPVCDRCSRAGYNCEGYVKPPVFINRDNGSMAISNRDHLSAAMRESSYQQRRAQRARDYSPLPNTSELLNIPQEVSLQVTETLFPALWYDFQVQCGSKWGAWNWVTETKPSHRSLLHNSLFAASAAYVGHQRGDSALVGQALRAYSKALAEMRDLILSKSAPSNDLLLSVCMAFQAYEMFQCTDGSLNSWAAHIGGALTIIDSDGPRPFGESRSTANYQIIRDLAILLALISRDNTMHAKSIWFKRSYDDISVPTAETMFENMAELASILGVANTIQTNMQNRTPISIAEEHKVSQLLQKGIQLDNKLSLWHQTLQETKDLEPNIAVMPTTEDGVFPASVTFKNGSIAKMHVYYWCQKLQLHEAICWCLNYLSRLNVEHTWPLNAPKENSASLAQSICQSLAYIREFSSTPMEGSQNVLYPLWVVSRYYARNSGCKRELLWCQQLCHLVAADGFQIAESLTNSDPWTPKYVGDENEGHIREVHSI